MSDERKWEELVKIALAVKPCEDCDSHSCRLARTILAKAGYKFIRTDDRGLSVWEKRADASA